MKNNTKPIRLGIIGTGLMFKTTHLPVLLSLSDLFHITVLCNRNINKAKTIASENKLDVKITDTYNDVLHDLEVDAVLIALPIDIQAKVTHEFLKSGKHVFQEKPIADNLQEASISINLADKMNLVFMIGENFRYRNEFKLINTLITGGKIGNPLIYYLNDIHYTQPGGLWSQTEWRIKGNHFGGYLIDGGTHIVAGMQESIKSNIVSIYALQASFNPSVLSKQPDTLILQMVFKNGLIGQLALGYGAIDHESRKSRIYGDKGTLLLDPKGNLTFWSIEKDTEPETINVDRSNNEFYDQFTEFYNAIINHKVLYSTAGLAYLDLKIILAGIHSANTGSVVQLSTFNQ